MLHCTVASMKGMPNSERTPPVMKKHTGTTSQGMNVTSSPNSTSAIRSHACNCRMKIYSLNFLSTESNPATKEASHTHIFMIKLIKVNPFCSRSAEELATDLWRQSRLADSKLKMGSCAGRVSHVELIHRPGLLLPSSCSPFLLSLA